ncbi:MAG TPA: glycosyltransferase family 2 protein [Chryseolinea sp.]|nr:glycosyltransferase family 2 protein [Chryseolinea sp.]
MVSIVLVTYNRASRLKLSIRDILNQTFKDFELIICDDCSTDSTEQVCREFEKRDSRIRYFRHPENIAMPANCNFGITQSNFDYVAILHDGDRFKPSLIERWYTAISNNDSVGFVFNSIGETDAQEKLVNSWHEFDEGVVSRDDLLNGTFFRRWKFDSPVYGQAMVKKSLLEERGYLSKEYGFYSDVDLWMDILHRHDAYYCADTLITGPTKDLQPRLFDDHLINHFLLMFSMQLKHRKKEFHNRPIALCRELILLMFQSLFFLTYCLLLIVKNYSLRSYTDAGKLLRHNLFLLIPWTIILVFYPILYPVLRLFTGVKTLVAYKREKKEPAPWLSWFSSRY